MKSWIYIYFNQPNLDKEKTITDIHVLKENKFNKPFMVRARLKTVKYEATI